MKKILIVEDEAAYAGLLLSILKSRYEVLTASNGKAGLTVALQYKPDLILLDNIMPIMSGMDMLTELRKDDYGRDAKVILLTNLGADSSIIADTVKALPLYYFVKSDTMLSVLLGEVDGLLADETAAFTASVDAKP